MEPSGAAEWSGYWRFVAFRNTSVGVEEVPPRESNDFRRQKALTRSEMATNYSIF